MLLEDILRDDKDPQKILESGCCLTLSVEDVVKANTDLRRQLAEKDKEIERLKGVLLEISCWEPTQPVYDLSQYPHKMAEEALKGINL